MGTANKNPKTIMTIYSVVTTDINDMSSPDVSVYNFTEKEKAQKFFNDRRDERDYSDNENYETDGDDSCFESYYEEDPLMDYHRVELFETETDSN